jgi:type VI secretion system secreted protein VgrG
MPDSPQYRGNAPISQENRLIKLDTPLGANILLPQRVIAHEKLGRSYQYTVDCLSLEPDIELKKLIAEPVTLWVRQVDSSYLPTHGYVHTIKKLGSDGQFVVCQLTFAPWLHFLKFREDARVWQDKLADEILTDVFNAHAQARGRFRFRLSNVRTSAPQRSYCVQYETDWNFVQRLMEEEGWFSYHEQDPSGTGHTLIITNDTYSLPALTPQAIPFHRAGTGNEVDKIVQWSGTRTLSSNQLTTQTFNYKDPAYPQERNVRIFPEHGASTMLKLEVYEYTGAYTHSDGQQGDRQLGTRMEAWESNIKRFHGVAGNRNMPVGHWFSLEDHPAHRKDSAEEREFVVVAVNWIIENNLPLSANCKDFPGSLKSELSAMKAEMGVDPQTGNERTGHCFNCFEAQRRKVPFRSLREHHKPVMHAQTAIVVGYANQEIYTDSLNRIKIKFHWDRINPGDEMASCWARVSYQNAGDGWGAVSVPRVGQEVIVMFLGGDIDRPVVTGRLYNNHNLPHWHTDGKISGYKSKEINGRGFNQLVLDDNTGQNRVHLYSTSANAQLNLGYLVTQQGNKRAGFYGSGFALSTDDFGAIVTNKGLYISTFGRPGAQGTQLDAREARQQLQAGLTLTQTLSETAGKSNAETLAGQDALDKFTDATQDKYDGMGQERANRFKEPVLLAASPAGIGLTTPQSTHIHAGEHVTLSSGLDANFAIGKSLVASVMEKISLFVYKAGIKLFAAKGKIEIQAQSDDLDIIAEKVLRLLSSTGRIEIAAKTEIVLSAGGTYIKLNAGGFTGGTSGAWVQHAASHAMPGPDSLTYPLPVLPKSICVECLRKARAAAAPFTLK